MLQMRCSHRYTFNKDVFSLRLNVSNLFFAIYCNCDLRFNGMNTIIDNMLFRGRFWTLWNFTFGEKFRNLMFGNDYDADY